MLTAAREDNCTSVEQLGKYEVYNDHNYREGGRTKEANSRMLTCRIGFKQNIGHLGKEIVATGVHGNCRTMRHLWPQALEAFWDRLARRINLYGVQILVGDFNMSLTQVCTKLRSRGILCDCIAWYPWMHQTERKSDQALGFDSCCIFYIGGTVQARLVWNIERIGELAAVADVMVHNEALDKFSRDSHPGQHWSHYKTQSKKVQTPESHLVVKLAGLLAPSAPQEQPHAIPRMECCIWAPTFLCVRLQKTQVTGARKKQLSEHSERGHSERPTQHNNPQSRGTPHNAHNRARTIAVAARPVVTPISTSGARRAGMVEHRSRGGTGHNGGNEAESSG